MSPVLFDIEYQYGRSTTRTVLVRHLSGLRSYTRTSEWRTCPNKQGSGDALVRQRREQSRQGRDGTLEPTNEDVLPETTLFLRRGTDLTVMGLELLLVLLLKGRDVVNDFVGI